MTIQFPEQMLDYPTMSKRIFSSIRSLLERAGRGISYVGEARLEARDRVLRLTRSRGFDTALQFLSLLDYLATTPDFRLLASANYQPMHYANETRSRRILLVCDYVMRNYAEPIKLSDAARLTNMSESAFCHFFKKMTGKNFVDYVNDVRIGNATRRLYETTDSISEICYSCGFNNTSNFIRVFKKKRGETPSEYRSGTRKIMKNTDPVRRRPVWKRPVAVKRRAFFVRRSFGLAAYRARCPLPGCFPVPAATRVGSCAPLSRIHCCISRAICFTRSGCSADRSCCSPMSCERS